MTLHYGGLVAMAARLPCQYPTDDCDKHRKEWGKGFTRCLNCQIREEAQRLRELDRVPV